MNIGGALKIAFCLLGLVAAGVLTAVDFTTSWRGIVAIINGIPSDLLSWIPFVMAGLALVMNSLSSFIMRYYHEQRFTDFSRGFIIACWIAFVSYDAASSFVGLLGEFNQAPISGFGEVYRALSKLDGMQVILCLTVACLATFGPLLVTVFADLLKHISEDCGLDISRIVNTGSTPTRGRR